MSIASEITRLQTAKANLKTAINNKGGSLTTETIDQYHTAVTALQTGLTIEGQQIVRGILTGTVDEFDTVYTQYVSNDGEDPTILITPASNTIPADFDDLGYATESGIEDDEIDMVSIFRTTTPQSETWVINESPSLENVTYNISFMSNNVSYDSITFQSNGVLEIYYNTTLVYGFNPMWESYRWINENYRTVIFETSPTGDLLTWLQANAVKQ